MIPEGTYKARGVAAALGYSSNDKEQVAVELELIEGHEDGEGQHITYYGFFTDKTTERTIESLRLLGWEGDDLSDLSGIDKNEVYAVIGHEEYEGKVSARVRWINADGASGLALKERMDEGSAKAFAERMKGHVLAQKQRTKGGSAPTPNGNGQRAQAAAASGGRGTRRGNTKAQNDDDIPY